MKKKNILSLMLVIFLFIITGCNKKNVNSNPIISNEDNNECCESCICGDTLNILKNLDSAWTLTEIKENGDYEYVPHAFINFNGIGKNKFAFFKNDENGNQLFKVTGTISITKNADIILIPDNEKTEITCKLGEEKDLIAVLECDNNFGTFTLQKAGTIELPSIIKDTLSKTKSINIKNHKTIANEKDVEEFIKIISNSKRWTGAINLPSANYYIELFDDSNNIAKIEYNINHYFVIEINSKYYNLINFDKVSLNKLLEKYD